jgi:uncharacterized protein (TIGR02266 family)
VPEPGQPTQAQSEQQAPEPSEAQSDLRARDESQQAQAQSERRSADRAEIEVDVSFSSESQFFAGLTGDISTGGLFVQTYSLRPVGTEVMVAFTLPAGEVRAPGVVRWVRTGRESVKPGLGIAFEGLGARERAFIEAFCKARPPLYHEMDAE